MFPMLTLILECCLLAALEAFGIKARPAGLIILLIAVFSVIYFVSISNRNTTKDVAVCLATGYLIRVVLLLWDIYGRSVYVLPNSGADSEVFYWRAIQYAMDGFTGEISYSAIMGNLFYLLGISRLYVQFLSMLTSLVAIHYANKTMLLADVSRRARKNVMWILCLLPNFAILSSIFLREAVVTMFVSLSVYQFVQWYKRGGEGHFILAFLFPLVGAMFHSGAVAVSMGYVMARFLVGQRTRNLGRMLFNVAGATVFFFAFVYIFNNHGDSFFAKMGNVETLEDIANTGTAGGSTYAAYVGDSSSIKNLIIYTIPRILYFLFSPFPWQWRGIPDIIAFCFSSCFYFWAIWKTILALREKGFQNKKLLLSMLIVCICAAIVFGWGVSNTGTAIRHRDKMVTVYAVMMAIAYGTPHPRQAMRYNKRLW